MVGIREWCVASSYSKSTVFMRWIPLDSHERPVDFFFCSYLPLGFLAGHPMTLSVWEIHNGQSIHLGRHILLHTLRKRYKSKRMNKEKQFTNHCDPVLTGTKQADLHVTVSLS